MAKSDADSWVDLDLSQLSQPDDLDDGITLTASVSDDNTSLQPPESDISSLLSDDVAASLPGSKTLSLSNAVKPSRPAASDITYDGCTSQNLPRRSDGDYFAVHFQDCYLDDVIFDNCILRRVRFENCLLVNVRFSNVVLVDVDIKGCDFNDYIWQNGREWDTEIVSKTFENVTVMDDDQPGEIADSQWLNAEKERQQKRLEEANSSLRDPLEDSSRSYSPPTDRNTPLYKQDKIPWEDEWAAYADEQEAGGSQPLLTRNRCV